MRLCAEFSRPWVRILYSSSVEQLLPIIAGHVVFYGVRFTNIGFRAVLMPISQIAG